MQSDHRLPDNLPDYKLSAQMLETAAESVATGLDVPTLAQRMLTLLCQTLAILRGEIFVVDGVGALTLLAFSGYTEAQHQLLHEMLAEMRLQKGLAKVVAQQNCPLILADVNCSEDWLPIPGLDDDICSAAALPLHVDGKLVGVISLLSNEGDYFTDQRVRQLQTLLLPLALTLHTTMLFAQLQKDQTQLQRLAVDLVNTQEAERKLIARELHDEVGQTLAGIKGSLLVLQKTLPESTVQLARQLDLPITLANETIGHMRRLAYALRPPILDLLGLDAALEALCQDFMRRNSLKIHYQGVGIEALPDELAITFYRFVQEALTNVVRHADAQQVAVRLAVAADQISITVTDDGHGFPTPPVNATTAALPGVGLLELRERFAPLHGQLQIATSAQGTTITATAPLCSPATPHSAIP